MMCMSLLGTIGTQAIALTMRGCNQACNTVIEHQMVIIYLEMHAFMRSKSAHMRLIVAIHVIASGRLRHLTEISHACANMGDAAWGSRGRQA